MSQLATALNDQSKGSWGFFHYYLGAKYSNELGYFNIYNCSLETKAPHLHEVSRARNLTTYEIVSASLLPKCPKQNFSTRRWESFKKEVVLLTQSAPTSYWESVFLDKGFNPPPFWTVVAGPIANLISQEHAYGRHALFAIDVILILTSSLLIFIFLGKKLGLVSLALSVFYFGTFTHLTSNFMQFSWVPLLTVSLICWEKRKFKMSGVALALASSLQAFAVLFAVPIFLLCFASRKTNLHKKLNAFLLSFILVLFSCFIVSSLHAGNIKTWIEWQEKINIHKNYLRGEIFNVGLQNLIGSILSPHNGGEYSYRDDYKNTIRRNKILDNNTIIVTGIIVLSLLAVSYAVIKSRPNNPLLYGYYFIYILLCLSPYYYLSLTLLPFFARGSSQKTVQFTHVGLVVILVIHLLLFKGGSYVNFIYYKHLISELLIYSFLAILFLLQITEKGSGVSHLKIGLEKKSVN